MLDLFPSLSLSSPRPRLFCSFLQLLSQYKGLSQNHCRPMGAVMKVSELEEQQGRNIYLSLSKYLSTNTMLAWKKKVWSLCKFNEVWVNNDYKTGVICKYIFGHSWNGVNHPLLWFILETQGASNLLLDYYYNYYRESCGETETWIDDKKIFNSHFCHPWFPKRFKI